MSDDFDVLIVDFNALAAVNLLDFVDDVILSSLDTQYFEDIVRVDVAFEKDVCQLRCAVHPGQ